MPSRSWDAGENTLQRNMAAQRILRVRRRYNQWVANETLEDYALRFTAKRARRWSSLKVANTALGAISFLALEAIGGAITLDYGFANAAAAILVVGAIIFATALPITRWAVEHGVDIDLLTRGAGFGYIGSTVTSLIYASFTFIFFAIEAVIMALALELCLGLPLWAGYIVSSIVVLPIVTLGITLIGRVQVWTQPLWIGLQVAPFLYLAIQAPETFAQWVEFPGRQGALDGSVDLVMFGAAATVVFSLIAQVGEQVDFLRFLPRRTEGRRWGWWLTLLAGGPGWIFVGVAKMLAGSYLAWLALSQMATPQAAVDPARMYLTAFKALVENHVVALALTGVFVVVCQIKINMTNAYAGSIAWSNFFSRLTHSHPGRVVWLVFNVAIALVLMEFGIYAAFEQILGLYSIVAIAWVGALVADLVINKPLRLSPPTIEFRRAHLYDVNPVGLGAMVLATIAAIMCFGGLFGPGFQALAPFVALVVAMVTAPAIAWATGGRYYLARVPNDDWDGREVVPCCICEHDFDTEDMAYCPAYGGAICSLCCSLDARCNDLCKPASRRSVQMRTLAERHLPYRVARGLDSQLGHFLRIYLPLGAVVALSLFLLYAHIGATRPTQQEALGYIFLQLFVVSMIIAGVGAWLYVLAQESRAVAQEETRRQTGLLLDEIAAHERTDAELQRAKEAAEAANLAKTRYVVGISHELRAPLNAIYGYAQLLERDDTMPPHRRTAVKVVRRSAEHLSGLIDGLLDISRIEAGHLTLQRDEVRTAEFLGQIADMFRLQAAAKGLGFIVEGLESLPAIVRVDEKRLRQILINLLSNALKFTETGVIGIRIRCRNQVADFDVHDSGQGIPPADVERIFEPFERGSQTAASAPGIGLGLTITKLLTEIMGGEISVSSTPGVGSVFKVRLLLSPAAHVDRTELQAAPVRGYVGRRRTLIVTDDDATHREMVRTLLAPLGFLVFDAPDGPTCLRLAEECRPDLVLLDMSMPGMDGREVAAHLRAQLDGQVRIIMISASAGEATRPRPGIDAHDDFLAKPLDMGLLVERIGHHLGLAWQREPAQAARHAPEPARPEVEWAELLGALDAHVLVELRRLAAIGHVRGLVLLLDGLAKGTTEERDVAARLRPLVEALALDRVAALIGEPHDE
jgi:signal transduction histidine kinase/CheY-like chemotaxis protein/purine-cytosine permease-like protein